MTDPSLVNCVWYWKPWLPGKPLVETEKQVFLNSDHLEQATLVRPGAAILDCNWIFDR